MTQRKQTRSTQSSNGGQHVDPEIMRLSELQLAHLGLVGIVVTPAGRASLAAAARLRLAADDNAE